MNVTCAIQGSLANKFPGRRGRGAQILNFGTCGGAQVLNLRSDSPHLGVLGVPKFLKTWTALGCGILKPGIMLASEPCRPTGLQVMVPAGSLLSIATRSRHFVAGICLSPIRPLRPSATSNRLMAHVQSPSVIISSYIHYSYSSACSNSSNRAVP